MTDRMVSSGGGDATTISATKATSTNHQLAENAVLNNNNNELESNVASKNGSDFVTNNNASSDSVSLSSPHSSYNSSYGSTGCQKLVNQSVGTNSSLTSLGVPGGVVTTQNISTVIRPKENNNSLQFVKIQTPELSKKAVEQIRIAEETKISKEKIKEVEEEWQNNLLNWKSKRRQQFGHTLSSEPNDPFDADNSTGGRKIKTFAEMLEQRAKSGNQLGFNLQRYIRSNEDEDELVNTELSDHKNTDANIDNAMMECLTSTTEQSNIHTDDNNQQQCYKSNDNRFDSDYEAHSSTSSGFNQTSTSKSPGSPDSIDGLQNNHQHFSNRIAPIVSLETEAALDDPKLVTQTCDTSNKSLISNTNNNHHNNTSVSHDERDNEPSLSIVTHPDTDRLNSTLKPCFNKPPTPSFPQADFSKAGLLPKLQEVNIKSDASRERDDDSDNSAYEDEDEEELEQDKEQRQLQRIAFVAKLKAFENLTKPTTHAPKFTPVAKSLNKKPAARTVKSEVEPIRDQIKKQAGLISLETQPNKDPVLHRQPSNPSHDKQVDIAINEKPELRNPKDEVSSDLKHRSAVQHKPVAAPVAPDSSNTRGVDKSSPILPTERHNIVPARSKQLLSNPPKESRSIPSVSTSAAGSPIMLNSNSKNHRDEVDRASKDLAERISNLDLSRQESDNYYIESACNARVNDDSIKYGSSTKFQHEQHSPRQTVSTYHPSDDRYNYSTSQTQMHSPTKLSPKHQQSSYVNTRPEDQTSSIANSIPYNNLLASRGQQKVMTPPSACPRQNLVPPMTQAPLAKHSPRSMDTDNQTSLHSNKHNGQVLSHQPSPKKQQVKENREQRTVLSVSGKKRCSSCKEELGRGAAAFVVESLSLVYHTNCFRCSVCHVNLSNGFRGVDVRVHAGALHCQNCYSKDGLNYSRV